MQPVWNEPALTFSLTVDGTRRTYLVASELHLGIESELARRGAFLRSRGRGLSDRLLAIAKAHRATRLILLGDVKHRIGSLSPQEQRDIPTFFERLKAFERVDIALGNHDAGLRRLLPPKRFPHVRFHPAAGFLLRGEEHAVACLHGHAWPNPPLLSADTFLVGHTHAAVALVDEHGSAVTEWGWLRGRLDPAAVHRRYGRRGRAAVIIFPPFNPLCGGTALNRNGILGPFAKLVDELTAQLYLLDGRAVGALAAFRRT